MKATNQDRWNRVHTTDTIANVFTLGIPVLMVIFGLIEAGQVLLPYVA